MAPSFFVTTGSSQDLLPYGAKPSTEPILNHRQLYPKDHK